MRTMQTFWIMLPTAVKLLLLGLIALAFVSVVRLARLSWCLFHSSVRRIPPEDILKRAGDPDLLATAALANSTVYERILANLGSIDSSAERSGEVGTRDVLRAAECKFLYLWEICYTEVAAVRKAAVVALLLSIVMVAGGACPIFSLFFSSDRRAPYASFLLALNQLFLLLALGLSVYTALYAVSGVLERVLAKRKARWKYVCAKYGVGSSGV
jgi:hypothetical protein